MRTRAPETPAAEAQDVGQSHVTAEIMAMRSLHGVELGALFEQELSRLGAPDTVAEAGRLMDYLWHDHSPPLGILTFADSEVPEHIVGVRQIGPGPVDSGVGFGFGATRAAVVARLPDAVPDDDGGLVHWVRAGALVVIFDRGRVAGLQLVASWLCGESEDA